MDDSPTNNAFFKTGIVLEDDGTSFARGKLHILQENTADDSNATIADSVVTINQSGNVGIGTTNPTDGDMVLNAPKLHVLHSLTTSGSYDLVARFQSGGDYDYTGGAILINHQNDRGLLIEGGRGLDNTAIAHLGLVDNVGTNSRVITLYNNNVGIGTTDPAAKLQVVGSIYASDGGTIRTYRSDDSRYGSIYTNTDGTYIESTSSGDNMYVRSVYNNVNIVTGSTTRLTALQNGNVGIGITNPQYKLEVNGSFAATTKSFVIPHPTKEGYRLRHGSLEGPENGVYVRGKSKDFIIHLPDYWVKLIDPDSITVNLTPIGRPGAIWVERIEDNQVVIGREDETMEYFYMAFAERADVDRLEVEIPPAPKAEAEVTP